MMSPIVLNIPDMTDICSPNILFWRVNCDDTLKKSHVIFTCILADICNIPFISADIVYFLNCVFYLEVDIVFISNIIPMQ